MHLLGIKLLTFFLSLNVFIELQFLHTGIKFFLQWSKTKRYLIYNIETKELAYTDDIGNFEGILKKMIKEYDSKYVLSEKFEKLRKIYFEVLTKNLESREISEIKSELKMLNIESFTFKEIILFNSIKNLLDME